MTLLSLTLHPPGGFSYRDPKTGWIAPREGQPFDKIARLLKKHRDQNPTLFTPNERTIQACYRDIDAFTCKRLDCDPAWCACPGSKKKPVQEPAKGCASCGGRKKAGKLVAGGQSAGGEVEGGQ